MSMTCLPPTASNGFRPDRLVSCAAFREQESQDVLQGLCVRGVAQERALPPDSHEAFVLQLVEVVRQRRRRNGEFRADLANHQPFGMCGQQQPDDAQPRFGAECSQHIGEPGDRIFLGRSNIIMSFGISIDAEIRKVNHGDHRLPLSAPSNSLICCRAMGLENPRHYIAKRETSAIMVAMRNSRLENSATAPTSLPAKRDAGAIATRTGFLETGAKNFYSKRP